MYKFIVQMQTQSEIVFTYVNFLGLPRHLIVNYLDPANLPIAAMKFIINNRSIHYFLCENTGYYI